MSPRLIRLMCVVQVSACLGYAPESESDGKSVGEKGSGGIAGTRTLSLGADSACGAYEGAVTPIYFVTTDASEAAWVSGDINSAMSNIRDWVQAQAGKTFNLRAAEVVHGEQSAAWYKGCQEGTWWCDVPGISNTHIAYSNVLLELARRGYPVSTDVNQPCAFIVYFTGYTTEVAAGMPHMALLDQKLVNSPWGTRTTAAHETTHVFGAQHDCVNEGGVQRPCEGWSGIQNKNNCLSCTDLWSRTIEPNDLAEMTSPLLGGTGTIGTACDFPCASYGVAVGGCDGSNQFVCQGACLVYDPAACTGGGTSPGGGGGCGDVTYQGYCDGNVAVWCDGGSLQSYDCGAIGQGCGWVNDSIGNYCVAAAQQGGCGNVTYQGYCDGNVAVWCGGGSLQSYDCGAIGQGCGWVNDSIGNYCVAAAQTDSCGGVTYQGYCDGSLLVWCDGGTIHTYNCSNVGEVCAWQNDSIGFNCL